MVLMLDSVCASMPGNGQPDRRVAVGHAARKKEVEASPPQYPFIDARTRNAPTNRPSRITPDATEPHALVHCPAVTRPLPNGHVSTARRWGVTRRPAGRIVTEFSSTTSSVLPTRSQR